ncbi:MAG: type IX secretion system outer membrane channel protein PorV [Bacteroidia bacterium]|nr:type IX secretion system outer membrane channel protein PorV [Bacteroidia bacterium]
MQVRITIFLLQFLWLSPFCLKAQDFFPINFAGQDLSQEAIYTAASFLMIPTGAAHTAMGNTGVATANDALASYYNPSGLAFADEKFGTSFTFSPWLRSTIIPGINFLYFSTYTRIDSQFSLGLSLRGLDRGELDAIQAVLLDMDKDLRVASDVSLAYRVHNNLSIGASVRFLGAWRIVSNGVRWERGFTRTLAGDLSMRYKKDFVVKKIPSVPLNFSAGLHISNMGPRMVYSVLDTIRDYLPTNLRLGWALQCDFGSKNSLTITNEIQKLLVPSEGRQSDLSPVEGMFSEFSDGDNAPFGQREEFILSAGLEFNFRDAFFIRQGYFGESVSRGARQLLTFGAGAKFDGISLDMSYWLPIMDNHPLENTFMFSIGYDFSSMDQEELGKE